jgi:ankyrin repeat protein
MAVLAGLPDVKNSSPREITRKRTMAQELTRLNPVPPGRTKLVLGGSLAAALLVGIVVAGIWRFRATPASALPDREQLDLHLLTAIRNSDFRTVQDLLQQGADANARGDGGDTALMQAALNADAAMMQLLLLKGADVHARGADGTDALLRAVHDPDKVRLLLGQGVRVDDRAVVLAALIPGAHRTVERLLAAGGNARAEVGGFTALMAAALSGGLESVQDLLDQGADVHARTPTGYTALYAAAQTGNAAIVELLIDRGADVNAHYDVTNSNGDFGTPALTSSLRGHAACLQLLLKHGADINVQGGPFDRTPLLGAATTGSEETVRLLLAAGANVHAQDWEADTALDWAQRRGSKAIVARLHAAGATASVPPKVKERARLHRQIDSGSVRRSLAASLPLLQQTGQRITEKRGCVTCHQHALVAMTVGLARRRGFAVDEAIASGEQAHVLENLERNIPRYLLGAGIDPMLAPYTLVGLAAEEHEPNRLTDALVHYLALHQQEDGRWQAEDNRPPEDGSDFMFTALSVRGLGYYAPPGRAREMNARLARARRWLVEARPADTVDQAFRLLGLGWAHAPQPPIQAAVRDLLTAQRGDGGWAQLPALGSDAYATGLALVALQQGGAVSGNDPAYRRGVEYLLKTQLADGSWRVPSRSFPVVEFTNSGFPHGGAQFISAAGTGWASMALALSP